MATTHELEVASRQGCPVILIWDSGVVHYADKVFVLAGALIIFEIGWSDPIMVPDPVHVIFGCGSKAGEGAAAPVFLDTILG